MGPGAPSLPPPPLFPLFFRPNWGLKSRENFFGDLLPPPPPSPPPVFEGLDPFLLCLFSLVHSKNQAANQMTYHDVIRTASNSLDCRRARHCTSTVPKKTTERVSDQTAQESWGSEFREVLKSMHNPPFPAALKVLIHKLLIFGFYSVLA